MLKLNMAESLKRWKRKRKHFKGMLIKSSAMAHEALFTTMSPGVNNCWGKPGVNVSVVWLDLLPGAGVRTSLNLMDRMCFPSKAAQSPQGERHVAQVNRTSL